MVIFKNFSQLSTGKEFIIVIGAIIEDYLELTCAEDLLQSEVSAKTKHVILFFRIGIKNDTYYVVNGVGSTTHSYHPRIKPENVIFPPQIIKKLAKQ